MLCCIPLAAHDSDSNSRQTPGLCPGGLPFLLLRRIRKPRIAMPTPPGRRRGRSRAAGYNGLRGVADRRQSTPLNPKTADHSRVRGLRSGSPLPRRRLRRPSHPPAVVVVAFVEPERLRCVVWLRPVPVETSWAPLEVLHRPISFTARMMPYPSTASAIIRPSIAVFGGQAVLVALSHLLRGEGVAAGLAGRDA